MPDYRVIFQQFLDNLGLGNMVDLITTASAQDADPATFAAMVENDQRYLDAFPEIKAGRDKLKSGAKDYRVPTAAEVIEYRSTTKDLLRNAGLPPSFYDQPQDFVDLMVTKDLSPRELETRIKGGFQKVNQAPQEVRDVFNSFFGAQGEGALAALFLDPTRAESVLGEMVAQAEVSGAGRQFGFDINLTRAERLREQGINDYAAASQGFRQAGELRPLEQETISEATDITEEDLVGGAFGLDEQGLQKRKQLERRGQERQAAFGGSGGAAQGQGGFGVGTAR